MSNISPNADRIADLIVHIARTSLAPDAQDDLTSAQWMCLRFFARANGSTRTPSAFASFQSTTRGTASQIIKSLETRGLISGHRSHTDKRSMRFDLTRSGRRLLSHDPLSDLTTLLGDMDSAARDNLLASLSSLSTALANQKQARAFGTCSDCTHFTTSGSHGFCACMAAALDADDKAKLCGSYRGPQLQGYSNDPA